MAIWVELAVGLTILIIGFVLYSAKDRIFRRQDKVENWHKEVHNQLSDIYSVGVRFKNRDHGKIEVNEVEELVEPTTELESLVKTRPIAVSVSVDPEVIKKVENAAAVSYHFAHLPKPEEDEDSIAGVLRNQYEMVQKLDADTDVKVEDVLEMIGEISNPAEELDISENEAEIILEEFEEEANRRMEDAEEMTVDEFMELPWKKVDQITTEKDRQRFIESAIEQYHEKALYELPREAKIAVEKSQNNL